MTSLILSSVARLVLPVHIIFALHLMLRGHNAPGGGFIAGLLAAAAIVLLYVAFGGDYVRRNVRINYRVLIAVGLALAGGTGIAALFYGSAFMEHRIWHAHAPILGDLELATTQAFDLGVFFTVVGVTLMIISILRKEETE